MFGFGCTSKIAATKLDYDYGYPAKMHVVDGWIQNKKFDYLVLQKKFSDDLPLTNISVQIQKQSTVTNFKTITINTYFSEFYLKELKSQNVNVFSIHNALIDSFPAKDIIFEYPLTIRGVTKQVKARTLIFIVNEFVYTFHLASFPKDFDRADSEFQLFLDSFHFLKSPK